MSKLLLGQPLSNWVCSWVFLVVFLKAVNFSLLLCSLVFEERTNLDHAFSLLFCIMFFFVSDGQVYLSFLTTFDS